MLNLQLLNPNRIQIVTFLPYNMQTIEHQLLTKTSNCSSLTKIALSDNLKMIGNGAFKGCSSLKSISIPASVILIDSYAFSSTAIETLVIPAKVDNILGNIVQYCMELKAIEVNNDNPKYKSINGVLYGADDKHGAYKLIACPGKSTTVDVPATVIEISEGAFNYGLESIYMNPSTPVDVTLDAFWDEAVFNELASEATLYVPKESLDAYKNNEVWGKFANIQVNDGSKPEISAGAVYEVNGIYYVVLDDSSVAVARKGYKDMEGGKWTFDSDFKYSGEVAVPSTVSIEGTDFTVTRVMKSTFTSDEVTSVVLPSTVSVIEDWAFDGCYALESVDLGGVKQLNTYLFGSNNKPTGIKKLDLGDGLKEVPAMYFYSWEALEEVVLGSSLDIIGGDAFNSCKSLKRMDIPASVTKVEGPFINCQSMTEINVASGNSNYASKNGVLYNKDFTTLLCCPSGKISYEIPSTVTTVGMDAIRANYHISSIVIPSSVTTIKDGAFAYCTLITGLDIPASVETIEGNIVSGCKDLSAINVDAQNKNYASMDGVLYNKSLTTLLSFPAAKTTVDIPDDVLTINESAFSGCNNLTSISIPSSVTSIGKSAFLSCASLKEINLSGNLKTIGDLAFYYCPALPSITIPNSVTEIGANAFSFCGALEEVVLGKGVEKVGANAFFLSDAIKSITVLSDVPPVFEAANYNAPARLMAPRPVVRNDSPDNSGFSATVYSDATLYVPSESVDAYKAAATWGNFSNIVGSDFSGISDVAGDAVKVWTDGLTINIAGDENLTVEVYSLSGVLIFSGTAESVDVPAHGMYIVRINNKSYKILL